MGFGGSFTFRNLRTSMVHHTKNLSPRKRLAVHRAMCHSESVAAKFYVPLNSVGEAAEVRRIQEEAAAGDVRETPRRRTRRQRSTISPEDSGEEEEEVEVCGSTPERPRGQRAKRSRILRLRESSDSDEPRSVCVQTERSNPSGYAVLGLGPSPDHSYCGTPVKVEEEVMDAIVRSGHPRVYLRTIPLCSSSSDDEIVVEEMPLDPSATF
ncbi:uncharacterized protein LOC134309114 [Trichomycterus rosablanca]|uniref:uncharacterized protein LOC134307514 n=1 Tax=Trichomycterus rosablanca TaxID=2290929 RepID=UPI002F3548E6